jgi:16S rRNA (uracil1498-N3)-methyltransferase
MKIGLLKSIPIASSLLVRELRRLLIAPDRLIGSEFLELQNDESHYLRRVLRLRIGDALAICDGCGQLWQAELVNEHTVRTLPNPCEQVIQPLPTLGLAVSIIRRGFDDVVRMACELGIDTIQPLRCERTVPQAEHRPDRWNTILREAVEQCERLWQPTVLELNSLDGWLDSSSGQRAVGLTRVDTVVPLKDWLQQTATPAQTTWLIVGPEGGWTSAELDALKDHSVASIHLGSSILRTSTAAVAGAVELVRWREQQLNS